MRSSKEKQRIFKFIEEDIPIINGQLKTLNGSRKLWELMRVRYRQVLPEIINLVKPRQRVSFDNSEPDYRPELEQLKVSLLTWVDMNIEDLGTSKEPIDNAAGEMLLKKPHSLELELQNIITESVIYIKKESINEKQIALEKIWDAFERLKTVNGGNKKSSLSKIINDITYEQEEIYSLIDKEFYELTWIGNDFSIRHSEVTQKKLPSSHYIEYLYFRALSLISLVQNELTEYR